MPEHGHALTLNPTEIVPNQPFFGWLKSRTSLFISQIFALLGFVSIPASTFYYIANLNEGERLKSFVEAAPKVQLAVDFAHIAVLTLFVGVLLGIRQENSEGTYRTLRAHERIFNGTWDDKTAKRTVKQARRHLRRFKTYFLWFWISMLALYIGFTFQHGLLLHDQPAEVTKSTLLDVKSIRAVADFLIFPFLAFALNNLSMLFIFWCFVVVYLPSDDMTSFAKQKLHIGISIFCCAMLTVAYPVLLMVLYRGHFTIGNLRNFATVFDGVSGVLNAVVLALLIARLDSKLIGLPSKLISVLYVYSAVQPLFAVFEQPDDVFKVMATAVLIIVFGFKIYFFLIIVYALQTGRILNYLICFPELARRVNSLWDNQFEIRASQDGSDRFKLTVVKNNKRVYTSHPQLRSMEDCDRKDVELREVMKRRAAYQLRSQSGTYWVDVVDDQSKVLCSGPFKSEEEAKQLIDESMNKIPYCRYDRS